MGSVESIVPYLEPIRRSVTVPGPPARAFAIFTGEIHVWWPRAQYSIHQGESATCGIEPRRGGEVYEVAKDGQRCVWGSVLEWDPPHRLVLSWHPGREPETAQEVELRFVAVPEGTRVELEHRDWAKFGAQAAEGRGGYAEGWAFVLDECYVAACSQRRSP
jgi:uncharacterized protein YndB with AHSA1/START domain